MIFVTVGTTAFDGLVKAADELDLDEEVIIQKAKGKFLPKNHKYFDFSEEFDSYLKKADVIVTHGGAGTLFKLMEMGKKVVGVENFERDDLHQNDLLGKLSKEGHIIWCKDISKLKTCINKARGKDFKTYQIPGNKIAEEIIKDYA